MQKIHHVKLDFAFLYVVKKIKMNITNVLQSKCAIFFSFFSLIEEINYILCTNRHYLNY